MASLENFYNNGTFYILNNECKQKSTKKETLQQLKQLQNTWNKEEKRQLQQIIDFINTIK